ncbi:tRNA (guanosine(46)-N7)-methyltransferase TrmB [Sphingobacteriales bacterium UPWRP_1]|nr:tRNA (guanosine(46)-N7)-methyltransferase TrmB [Sphingobacteriales bacterium TSM_CSS]PSJ78373.1 tRNA (guanosine(46)-N7)-methyltransferase TrmB [Sphingobacteriales bacterium UPWRP_1]
MGKGKLAKFAEIKQMPHVFENRIWKEPVLYNFRGLITNYRTQWCNGFFGNQNPLILELGCGYGEYTVAIAQIYPQTNVIGIDIKGNRIWTGASFVLQHNLANAAFVRTPIELIDHYFAPGEVSEIWLPFPDPQKDKPRKRLTSLQYLQLYRKILKPDGIIHLKTDSDLLYQCTLETLQAHNCPVWVNYPDVQNAPNRNQMPLLSVATRYQKLNLSGANTIKYLQFGLNLT